MLESVFNNGRQEPSVCDCGGDMVAVGDDVWQCKDCGKEVYIDRDGDLISETYDSYYMED